MAITPEQARAELARRRALRDSEPTPTITPEQARAELQRRRQQDTSVSSVPSEPVPLEDQARFDAEQFLQRQVAAGEIIPENPTFFQNLAEEFPQTGGGMVGAGQGTEMAFQRARNLPGPLRATATVAGGVSGAFGGGFLGRAAQLGYRNRNGDVLSFEDIMTDSLIAGAEEAASELAGFGVVKAGSKAFRFIQGPRVLKKGAREAAGIAATSGTSATKSQLFSNPVSEVLEGLSQKFVFGGGALRRLKGNVQQTAIKARGDVIQSEFAEAIGGQLTPTEAGEVIFSSLQKQDRAFRLASRGMYRQVDKSIRRLGIKNTAIVDITPLKRFAKSRLSPRNPKLGSSAKADELAEKILLMPDNMTFAQAAKLQSGLFKERSEAAVLGGSPAAEGLSKLFSKMAHKAIEDAGTRLPKTRAVVDQWKAANAFYRTGKEAFNNKIIKRLAKSLEHNPEELVNVLFKKEGVTNVARTKMLLSARNNITPDAWKTVQSALADDIFQRAFVESAETGLETFNGRKVSKRLRDLGDGVLKATFTSAQRKSLEDFAEGAKNLQRVIGQVPGEVRVPLLEVGAVGQATRGDIASGLAVLGLPRLYSRIAMNPKWTEIALDLQRHPGSAGNWIRFGNLVKRITMDEEKRLEAERRRTKAQASRRGRLQSIPLPL